MIMNREFIGLFGENAFESDIKGVRNGNLTFAVLPSPITAPFSQGERQVYIMSLYLALLRTSRKDIPFFIDTPFSRIDSNHRTKIVSEFFMGLNNQMFILSTDEELVGDYKYMMEDKISNTFMLEISNYGSTKLTPNKYFGG